MSITVLIPSHRGRATSMLMRALLSVREQLPCGDGPPAVHVELDEHGQGAAATRTAGLAHVETPWLALLDSDDWFYPEHLATLVAAQEETDADYLFSYFTVHDAWEGARPDVDPLGTFGRVFDPRSPHQTTTTILVRTDLARAVGGWATQPPERRIEGTGLRYGEDWQFTLDAVDQGACIVHVPRRTWAWRHHELNTGGLPGEGDARA